MREPVEPKGGEFRDILLDACIFRPPRLWSWWEAVSSECSAYKCRCLHITRENEIALFLVINQGYGVDSPDYCVSLAHVKSSEWKWVAFWWSWLLWGKNKKRNLPEWSSLERLIEIFTTTIICRWIAFTYITDYSGTKLRFSDDITGNSTTASSLGLSRALPFHGIQINRWQDPSIRKDSQTWTIQWIQHEVQT